MKEITWKQIYNAIETQKNGLYENFGEKEVMKLKEKFNYSDRIYGSQKDRENMQLIDRFDEWCMNYTG